MRTLPVASETALGERIQKVLARAGIGSRRAVEAWIEQGAVRVNNTPAEIGARLERDDRVTIHGRHYRVVARGRRPARWLRYHKPEGRVSTRHDPEGRPTVFEQLPKLRETGGRWVALGRLDVNTTGLMLFTDDGELANALTHPSAGIEREYAVRVRGAVDETVLDRLRTGIELEDGPARFERVVDAGGQGVNHWYHVILREGRKHEVRRLWEAVGCQVSRLTRVRFGPITLPRHLRAGRFEDLPDEEVRALTAGVDTGSRGGELTLEPFRSRRAAAGGKRAASRRKSPRRRRD